MRFCRKRWLWPVLFTLSLFNHREAHASDRLTLSQLKQLSLEELLNVEVTVAGQSPQAAGDAPAAVYVITQADMQHMGATNILEALRLVPGLQVSQVDDNKWAVGIRGNTFLFANKLLVMMDGRTVYTPLFSGVYWDMQDTVLADIERIEVVRGPGAATWGSNAVNGVINIITRSAQDTPGNYLHGLLGTEQGLLSARHGGALSENTHYRIYGKYRHHDNAVFQDGSKATDGWYDLRGGFRLDWRAGHGDDTVTLQGEVYQGARGTRSHRVLATEPFEAAEDVSSRLWGTHLLGRWSHETAGGSQHRLQAYYDYLAGDNWFVKDARLGTLDLDYQYHTRWRQHTLVVGGGYRYQHDAFRNTDLYRFHPRTRQTHLFSLYLQDEIAVVPDSVWLTLGSRFEHNDYSGFEVQPSARLRWQPDERQTLWAAVSRAVRIPSRWEQDASLLVNRPLAPGVPVATALTGNPGYGSEVLLAYELGYRVRFSEQLNMDLALYYNDYDHLGVFEPLDIITPPALAPLSVARTISANSMEGESYGLELSLNWTPVEFWRLRASYSYLKIQYHYRGTPQLPSVSNIPPSEDLFEGGAPVQQANLLSSYQLTPAWSIRLFARYMDRLPVMAIDDFVTLDLGLRWQPGKSWALSIYGRNLLDDRHQEFDQVVIAPVPTEVQRNVYVRLEWQF